MRGTAVPWRSGRTRRGRRAEHPAAGFTLIELLTVMVILGVLTAIAIPVYSTLRTRAQVARTKADISAMADVLRGAQAAAQASTLTDATGFLWTGQYCITPVGRDLRSLPRTDRCWQDYLAFWDALSARSGEPLTDFRDGDVWGSPYVFDPNEGEPLAGDCFRTDQIRSAGPNGVVDTVDDIKVNLPRFKTSSDC